MRASPPLVVLNRNFAFTYTLLGYFWDNMPDFQHSWIDFGHFWTDFEHFLNAFISRFWVNRSGAQLA